MIYNLPSMVKSLQDLITIVPSSYQGTEATAWVLQIRQVVEQLDSIEYGTQIDTAAKVRIAECLRKLKVFLDADFGQINPAFPSRILRDILTEIEMLPPEVFIQTENKPELEPTKKILRNRTVAIFAALQIEKKILIDEWKLTNSYPSNVWHGAVGQVSIIVYGPDEMGRVAAAVETMELLHNHKPDMLIISGIAGGFERENVAIGDVIIASEIVDLATRKILETGGSSVPQFRPKQYETDSRLSRYLRSGSFEELAWQREVLKACDWPEGRRPTIRYGALASLDEVVSSDDWVSRLVQAWPKLLGVEMEAGGICAAARKSSLPVAVIRAISDGANPAKTDTIWRKLGMKTIAHLLSLVLADQSVFFRQ